MPKRSRNLKLDLNRLAHQIAGEATGSLPPKPEPKKNPAAVALGRLGGLKGGKARAKALSADELSHIGKKAAKARWSKNPQ
jgi:hypothetical protein